jgi:aminomethyltransferase
MAWADELRTIHKFNGSSAGAFLEYITPSDIAGLKPDHSTYSAMLNDDAGIVDDTIVTKLSQDEFVVVSNAGTRERVVEYIDQELKAFKSKHRLSEDAISWNVQQSCSLLAVQGPLAVEILQSMSPTSASTSEPFDFSTLSFGQSHRLHFPSTPSPHPTVSALAWRTGYTGEDGFELLVEPSATAASPSPGAALARAILTAGTPARIRLAGLGARDALRLEAGLCLHGADIDEAVTPLAASLAWIVPRARRRAAAGFKGAGALYGEGARAPAAKRVGVVLRGGAAARHGAPVVSAGRQVGVVTSGAPSPVLGRPIAMASVERGVKVGDEVAVVVRGKERAGEVVKMPFVPTRYYKAPEGGSKKP